jgi:N6-adenosine-specific RNA methylase IME4
LITSFSDKKYPVVLADFPWKYYGSPTKDQAAGKHYNCLTDEEIFNLPVRDVLLPKSILFVWATGPKLDVAIEAIKRWNLYYRGIAFDWCKTTQDGKPINGQGGRPSLIKHAGELVLWASSQARGRPLPIKDEGMASWVFEPRPDNVHSRKPEAVQDRIEQLLDGPYLEIFARRRRPGWDAFGDELDDT